MWQILWIALLASLDCLSVGITYGMRKIRIPWISMMILSICSGIVMFASMKLGHWIMQWFSASFATTLGAMVFVFLGVCTLVQGVRGMRSSAVTSNRDTEQRQKKRSYSLYQVLQSPVKADRDQSGTISPMESFLLGFALSLDTLVIGLGTAMMGVPPTATAIAVTLMSGFFLYVGIALGRQFVKEKWKGPLVYVAGIGLILIGVSRLF